LTTHSSLLTSTPAFSKQLLPTRQVMASLVIHQGGRALVAELDHVAQFEQGEAEDADGRRINKGISVAQVVFQIGLEGGQRFFIDAQEQCFSRRCGQDFIKVDLKRLKRNLV